MLTDKMYTLSNYKTFTSNSDGHLACTKKPSWSQTSLRTGPRDCHHPSTVLVF